jgi:uncharacterized membrane protein
MTLKICELISILLSALVVGAFWGPWLALSRSVDTLPADVFIAVSQRMIRNMEPFMTALIPVSLLSIISVVYLSFNERPKTAYLSLAGFSFFMAAVFVTVLQVSIVSQIKSWTVATLPDDWEELRDRWKKLHIFRVVMSISGLALLVFAAIN